MFTICKKMMLVGATTLLLAIPAHAKKISSISELRPENDPSEATYDAPKTRFALQQDKEKEERELMNADQRRALPREIIEDNKYSGPTPADDPQQQQLQQQQQLNSF